MIFAFGAHGHEAGRFYHEHPWLFISMIVILIGLTVWRRFGN
jgi:hypothetical protein